MKTFAHLLAIVGMAIFTAGLVFSIVRRRQYGEDYILFWRMGPKTQAITRHMFFRGNLADISRILLAGAVTLLFVLSLLQGK